MIIFNGYDILVGGRIRTSWYHGGGVSYLEFQPLLPCGLRFPQKEPLDKTSDVGC